MNATHHAPAPDPSTGRVASSAQELSHADLEALSRLIDGDCDGEVTVRACTRWCDDAGLRSSWHCYHLIGDVLRSEELSQSPRRDEAFLQAVRAQLAAEPPIVAPLGPVARHGGQSWRRWMAPGAVAAGVAGVAVVAGVAMSLRQEAGRSTTPPEATLAAASTKSDPAVLRDARLDLYLRAHQNMRLSTAAAMPGGGLQNVDVLLPPR